MTVRDKRGSQGDSDFEEIDSDTDAPLMSDSPPSSRHSSPKRSPKYLSKKAKIEQAIKERDALKLKSLALERGGLLDDKLRLKAWPIILNIDEDSLTKKPRQEELEAHTYYNQVILDVNRSIKRFPPSIPENSRLNLQDKLVNVIMRVLTCNPDLHYYQGYHDICVTILLVVNGDEDLAFQIIEQISLNKLSVYMESTMQSTANRLELIFAMISTQSHQLRTFLDRSDCGIMFCLSWCITWFGHDLDHYSTLVRLYDLFLSCPEPLMPVYLSACLVLDHTREILAQECSLDGMHGYLGGVIDEIDTSNEGDEIEQRILEARKMLAEFPVEKLERMEKERKIKEEEFRKWSQSILGMTILRIKPWRTHIASAVIVVAIAIAYQMYRKSHMPAVTER